MESERIVYFITVLSSSVGGVILLDKSVKIPGTLRQSFNVIRKDQDRFTPLNDKLLPVGAFWH